MKMNPISLQTLRILSDPNAPTEQRKKIAGQLLVAGHAGPVLDTMEQEADVRFCSMAYTLVLLLEEHPEVCALVNQRILDCSHSARNWYAQLLQKIGSEDSVEVLALLLASAWEARYPAEVEVWCNAVRHALDALCLRFPARFTTLTLLGCGSQRLAVCLPLLSAYKSLPESVKTNAARAILVALADNQVKSDVEHQMRCSRIERSDLLSQCPEPPPDQGRQGGAVAS